MCARQGQWQRPAAKQRSVRHSLFPYISDALVKQQGFTISQSTLPLTESVRSHTVANDQPFSGLAAFAKQIPAVSKNKLFC